MKEGVLDKATRPASAELTTSMNKRSSRVLRAATPSSLHTSVASGSGSAVVGRGLAATTTTALQSSLMRSMLHVSGDGELNSETMSLSRQLRDALNGAVSDHSSTSSPDLGVAGLLKKAYPFKAALLLLKERLPSLSWFFHDIWDVFDALLSELAAQSRLVASKSETVKQLTNQVQDAMDRVRRACQQEIQASLAQMDTRDHEIHAAEELAETLASRCKELEQQNVKLRQAVHNMSRRESEFDRETEMRRAEVRETHNKSIAIVQENQYLRQICRHNRDLLQEVDELREANARASEKAKEEITRAHVERDAAAREADGALAALRRSAKTAEAMQSEIRALKTALALGEEHAQQLHAELEYSAGIVTPRPERGTALQQLMTTATTLLGEGTVNLQQPSPNGIATRALHDHLVRIMGGLCESLTKAKVLLQKQAWLMEYISTDDFERLARCAANAQHSWIGDAQAVDFSNNSKDPSTKGSGLYVVPTLAAPIHSRVMIQFGPYTSSSISAPQTFATATGPVGCRMMMLEEVLLVIDEIRQERQRMLGTQPSPVACVSQPMHMHVRKYAAARNSGNAAAAQEFLVGLEYSLDLHRYAPAVELFRRISRELSAPEGLFVEVINGLDTLSREVAAVLSEQSRSIEISKLPLKALRRRTMLSLIAKVFPSQSTEWAQSRLTFVAQQDLQRLAKVDQKLAASLSSKEEMVVEHALGVLLPPEVPLPGADAASVIVTGVAPRQGPSGGVAASGAIMRRNGSALLPPMSAAIMRGVLDDHDLFVLEVIQALLRRAEELKPPEEASDNAVLEPIARLHRVSIGASDVARSVAVAATRDADPIEVQRVASACAAFCFESAVRSIVGGPQGQDSISCAAACAAIRLFHFPATLRASRTSSTADNGGVNVLEGLKLVETIKKNLTVQRSLQK